MKGYKAFKSDWTCRGFQYEIGKTYELEDGQELQMCQCGFHFCKNPIDVFGYYPLDDKTLIAEVEALGEIQQEGTKYVTNKIRIVKEFTRKQLQALILDGKYNTGKNNSGNCNSGDWNSGNRNSGDYNSGNKNSGDYNSGNCNSGNCNSGDWNSGDWNSGNCNSGDYNSGNCNSGDWNSGNCNSGDWNSGNRNSGIFNTNEPKMRAFNKECDMTYREFIGSLDYSWFGLCNRIANKDLVDEDADRIKALPNFDADIFKEITGIEVK